MRPIFATATILLLALSTPSIAQESAPAAEAAPAASASDQSTPETAPTPPPAEAAPAPEAAPPAEPAAPATPPQATSGLIAPPPSGKGQVVFFRQSKLVGAALSFSVHEGETGIGKLGNGSYFIQVSDPGPHTFTTQSEAVDRLTLEVEAGETYYVKQSIGVGVVMGRPHLAPSDSAEFEKSKVKLSTKKASDLKPKT